MKIEKNGTTRHVVVTPFGTFKRSSKSRSYSHVVVIEPPTDDQINTYYRARGRGIETIAPDQQADTMQYRREYWAAFRSRIAGWTSRLDLAQKLQAAHPGFNVHIYDAETGAEVA